MPTTGTVDERVVEMRIDHEKFESGAKKTISILESLDKGLKSLGDQHTDGFDNIGGALDKVTNKISFFGTVGDQVIRNLTNKAMELAGQLGNAVSSLTTAQIAAGWSKYADKTQGVQTIMAATAKDWEDQGAQMEWVNEQLEKLNWFTDETSYNFFEMVNNIGKFTSNGVKLETAVTAMEGISTWAALSGANANEASRAMYNLSQALATGSVKLIDWKSIENANMATREFKETALETAVALGTLQKNADGSFTTLEGHMFTTEQFNTQLSDGWFSSDVLLQTLQLYGEFTDALNEVCNATDLTASEVLQAVDAYKEGGAASKEYEDTCRRLGFTVSELNPYMKTLADEGYELGYRAFKAAQEAKTFKEAVDATKDAVSTGWMNIFETMFGNYLQAKELWTDIAESFYNIFAEPVNQLQELVNVAFGGLFQKDLSPHLTARDNFIELNEQLEKAGFTWENFVDSFGDYDSTKLESLVNEYGSLNAALQKGAVDAETFEKVLKRMAGIHEGDKPESTSRRIEKVGKDGKKIIELYEGTVVEQEQISEESKNVIDSLIDDAKKYTNTIEEAKTGSEYFTEGLKNVIGVVEDFVNAVDGALQLLFGDNSDPDNIVPWTAVLGERLYFALKAWNDFTDGLRLKQDEETGVDEIADLSERIANVASVFLMVGNAIHTVWSVVTTVVRGIVQAVRESGILSSIGNAILIIFSGLAAVIRPVIDYISDLIAKARELGGMTWVEWLTDKLALLGIYIEFAATKFKEFMETKVAAKVLDVVTRLVGLFTRMKEAFSERGFVGAFEVLQTSFTNFLQRHPRLMKAFNAIKTVFMVIGGAIMLVGSAIAFIVGQIGRFISFIRSAFSEGGISSVFDSIIVKLQEVFKDHPRIVNALTTVKQILSELITSIADYFNRLVNFGKRLREAFQENGFAGVIAVISQKINEFLEKHPKLAAFITWVQNAFTKVSEAISKVWTAISSFISGISFQDIFSKLPSFSDIGSFFSRIYTSIVAWFNEIKEKIKAKDFAGVVQTIIDGIKNAFTNVGNKFGEIKTALSEFFEKIGLNKEFFKNLLPNLLEFITTWSEALKGVAIVGILLQVRKLIRNIGLVFDEFSGLIGVPRMKALRGIIISVGLALLMLAGALYVVSLIPADNLMATWMTLITLVGAIVAYAAGLKFAKADKALMALGLALIGLAALAGVLYGLSKMGDEDFKAGFGRLFLVMVLVGAFFAAIAGISRLARKNMDLKSLLYAAISLIAITFVLKKLGKMDTNVFGVGFARLIAVLLVFVGLIHSIKNVRTKQLKSLLYASVLLLAMIFSLKLLGKMKFGEIIKGFVGLLLIVPLMIVLIRSMNNVHVTGFSLGAILLTILGIVVIAREIERLAKLKVSGGKLIAAAGAIALALIAIAAAIGIISIFGKEFDLMSLLALAAGVAAFFFIGEILAKLSGQDWKQMAAIAAVITLVVLAIVGILALCGAIGASMLVGAVLLSAALVILAGAFWIIMKIGNSTMDMAVEIATKLGIFMDNLQPFLDKVRGLTGEDAGKIGLLIGILLELAVVELISAIDTILAWLVDPNIGSTLNTLLTNLSPFIEGVKSLNASDIKKVGIFAGILLAAGAAELVGGIDTILAWLVDTNFATMLSDLVTNLTPFLNGIKDLTENHVKGARNLKLVLRAMVAGEGFAVVGGWFDGLIKDDYATKLSTFMTSLSPFLESIAGIDQNLLANARSTLTTISIWNQDNTISQFGEQIRSFYGALNDKRWGKTGPGENLATLKDAISTFADFADAIVKLSGVDSSAIGVDVIGKISDSITLSEYNLSDTLVSTVNGAISTATASSYAEAMSAGQMVGYGLAKGMRDTIWAVEAAARALANAAIVTTTGPEGFDEHSPSKVFQRIGAFLPAGLAKGVEDNIGTAEGSMTILASGVIAAMEIAMAKVATVADEGFEFNPTITPVVDLSNVSSAAGSVAGMFGGISPMMRGSVAVNADRAQNTAATVMSSKGPSAVDEIQNLSDRIDSMVETMANLQIVLDSGELVGATSRKMDNAFGVMQMRRERGN